MVPCAELIEHHNGVGMAGFLCGKADHMVGNRDADVGHRIAAVIAGQIIVEVVNDAQVTAAVAAGD